VHVTFRRTLKRFTSATEQIAWRPVDRHGRDEPMAVFDPDVWRALIENDEPPLPVKRRL
jgi:hypothetical protein